ASINPSDAVQLATDAPEASARPPPRSISAATSCATSGSTSLTTTPAPSPAAASANARPRPRPAPVTTIPRPTSRSAIGDQPGRVLADQDRGEVRVRARDARGHRGVDHAQPLGANDGA